jgi:hypothetical protein
LEEVHETARAVSSLPFASSVVAVACEVPTAVIELGARDTVTDATGASVTVIDDVPTFPSLVAVIVVLPAPIAVTRPFASTVAAAVLVEPQTIVRPVSTLPFASVVCAVNCCVALIPRTRIAAAGFTVTVATGIGLTVITAVEVLPPAVALTVTDPAASAVSKPVEEIDAIAGSELDQCTVRFETTCPVAVVNVAVNCSD